MVFPQTIEDNVYEMFIGGRWTNITSDIYNRDAVTITRGYSSEKASGAAQPSRCDFTLDNTSGKYSPRNPLGVYYGTFGQNTPVRVSTRITTDSFNNTIADNWGLTDNGIDWDYFYWGAGGAITDFDVAGGVGTQVVGAANSYRISTIQSVLFSDVEIRATCSIPFTDVTGDDIQPLNLIVSGIGLAGAGGSDYFIMSLKIEADESITVRLNHFDGTEIAALTTLSWTYVGNPIRAAFQMEGQVLRAKIWDTITMVEPVDWDIEGSLALDAYLPTRAPGWVGIRSGLSAGNTNAPVTFSYDDFEIRIPRFIGEVSSWPTQWDVSGNDVYIPLQASGLRRRLSQGQAVLDSPYKRGNVNKSFVNYDPGHPAHLLYYPFEDGSRSTSIASGLADVGPMELSGPGTVTFQGDSTSFAGSAPIAKLNAVRAIAPRISPAPAATGEAQMMLLINTPTAEDADDTYCQMICNGTLGFIDMTYQTSTGSGVKLHFYDQSRTLISTSATFDVDQLGVPLLFSIELTQNGANIDYVVAWTAPGSGSGTSTGGTLASRTIGAPIGMLINPYTQCTQTYFGHAILRNDIISIFSLGQALIGYPEDFVTSRIERLCGENDDIPIASYQSDVVAFTQVGIQTQKTLLDLLDEAAAADLGYLYEARGIAGFVHRYGRSLYNQDPILSLDYSTGQVQPPFGQVDDDQLIVNDYTATRYQGSSYQATQTTGPLALTSPSSGNGVGRYNKSDTLNVAFDSQLPDIANWVVHVGTDPNPRYPQVEVNLGKMRTVSLQKYVDALSVDLFEAIEILNPKSLIINGTIDQIVVGYTETISSKVHNIKFVCQPGVPYEVAEAAATSGDTNEFLMRCDTDESFLSRDVTFVGANAGVSGNNASLNPTIHASAAAGDLMLLCAGIRTGNPNTPSGWTLINNAGKARLFAKVHSGSESTPTVSFTGGSAGDDTLAQIAVFRGVDLTTTRVGSITSNASQQNISYNPFTQSDGASLAIVYGFKGDDWTSVNTLANMTEIGETVSTAGNDAGLVWDYKISQDAFTKVSTGFVVTGGASATAVSGTIVIPAPAYTAGNTSIKVYTPVGSNPTSAPLWTTVADDYPLYLEVDGLKVRATACTGSGRTQTFTVDALAVGRALGSSVNVWNLPVLAQ